MSIKTKTELQEYFKTGKKPTQQQFWDWMDSYYHKNEKLPGKQNVYFGTELPPNSTSYKLLDYFIITNTGEETGTIQNIYQWNGKKWTTSHPTIQDAIDNGNETTTYFTIRDINHDTIAEYSSRGIYIHEGDTESNYELAHLWMHDNGKSILINPYSIELAGNWGIDFLIDTDRNVVDGSEDIKKAFNKWLGKPEGELVPSHNIYVNGNSETTIEEGSVEKPYKNIQTAIDNASPGDIINISADIYTEDITISNIPITLRSESTTPHQKTIIEGNCSISDNYGNVNLENLEFDNITLSGKMLDSSFIYGKNLKINGNISVLTQGGNHIYESCYFNKKFDIDTPTIVDIRNSWFSDLSVIKTTNNQIKLCLDNTHNISLVDHDSSYIHIKGQSTFTSVDGYALSCGPNASPGTVYLDNCSFYSKNIYGYNSIRNLSPNKQFIVSNNVTLDQEDSETSNILLNPNTILLSPFSDTLDTGWKTPVLNHGIKNLGQGYSSVRYKRKGNEVRIEGITNGGTSQTAGDNYILFTLPEGFRPIETHVFPVMMFSASAPGYSMGKIDIRPNGDVVGIVFNRSWTNLGNITFFTDEY